MRRYELFASEDVKIALIFGGSHETHDTIMLYMENNVTNKSLLSSHFVNKRGCWLIERKRGKIE